MKKKTFFPHGGGWIFGISLLLFISFAGIYCIIEALLKKLSYWSLLISVPCFIIITIKVIQLLITRIEFREDEIYMPGDSTPKNERIQYETKIKYSDIESIAYVEDTKDSRGRSVKFSPKGWTPRYYLEFTLKNGKKKRLTSIIFSRRQREKIINLAKECSGISEDKIERQLVTMKKQRELEKKRKALAAENKITNNANSENSNENDLNDDTGL